MSTNFKEASTYQLSESGETGGWLLCVELGLDEGTEGSFKNGCRDGIKDDLSLGAAPGLNEDSEDGFEDGCSEGSEDGSSLGAEIGIEEESKIRLRKRHRRWLAAWCQALHQRRS
jgi:hypothetical protein